MMGKKTQNNNLTVNENEGISKTTNPRKKGAKSAGTLVYRNVTKEERKKIEKYAETIAQEYGVMINIIEK